ncbi:hypothetical protein LMG9964_05451 [Paraburkholderia phenoliruptrix]|uniref:Uncharacterized protein n=1 Tax=Paraburkholderia phenoliruptrix TaxID=252970 RepID=A0A6J5KEJ5_9BURK|nr:hypothetical protein LMG9964_05451 [Paraburkholderia phenoliruptrix]
MLRRSSDRLNESLGAITLNAKALVSVDTVTVGLQLPTKFSRSLLTSYHSG